MEEYRVIKWRKEFYVQKRKKFLIWKWWQYLQAGGKREFRNEFGYAEPFHDKKSAVCAMKDVAEKSRNSHVSEFGGRCKLEIIETLTVE